MAYHGTSTTGVWGDTKTRSVGHHRLTCKVIFISELSRLYVQTFKKSSLTSLKQTRLKLDILRLRSKLPRFRVPPQLSGRAPPQSCRPLTINTLYKKPCFILTFSPLDSSSCPLSAIITCLDLVSIFRRNSSECFILASAYNSRHELLQRIEPELKLFLLVILGNRTQ